MSTNKSQNLNLHLWEPQDNFLRTEFNENFAALDTAVKADRDAIATVRSAAQTAQTAANNAQSTANAALVRPYVIGIYTGNGKSGSANAVTLNTGFCPSFVIIGTNIYDEYLFLSSSVTSVPIKKISVTFSSNKVSFYSSESDICQMNRNNCTYHYIAFR